MQCFVPDDPEYPDCASKVEVGIFFDKFFLYHYPYSLTFSFLVDGRTLGKSSEVCGQ